MAECGWAWSERGKEGIRVLDNLEIANGHGTPLTCPYLHPLPGYERAGSDISSLAPSQSASQIGHSSGPSTLIDSSWRSASPLSIPTPPKPYTLQIPPAHSIGEYAMPNGTLQPATIEEEPGGGSSAEEDEAAAAVEVYENPRFSKGKPKAKASLPVSAPPSRHVSFSVRGPKASTTDTLAGGSSSLRGDSPNKKSRTRAGSMLGSLAALFHVGGSRTEPEHPLHTSPSKTQSRWQTRIDKNLASVRRGDSSDDDLPALSHSYSPRSTSPAPVLLNSPVKGSPSDGAAGDTHRLKKRTLKRGSVQTPSSSRIADSEKGYASDTVTESVSKARAKSTKQKAHAKPASELGANGSPKLSTPKKNEDVGAGPSDVTVAQFVNLQAVDDELCERTSEDDPCISRLVPVSAWSAGLCLSQTHRVSRRHLPRQCFCAYNTQAHSIDLGHSFPDEVRPQQWRSELDEYRGGYLAYHQGHGGQAGSQPFARRAESSRSREDQYRRRRRPWRFKHGGPAFFGRAQPPATPEEGRRNRREKLQELAVDVCVCVRPLPSH
ncbi:hypothetical protein BV20DRAFT_242179 [Pilatotrama ljubarskyi]|nr:hypothetical protein BV20DRAFT_242179 [Pilatotrama ljubarskyi]